MNTWATGYATQAEARAAVLERMNKTEAHPWNLSAEPLQVEITAVTRRENGDPLVSVTRTLVKTEYTIEVDVEQVLPVPNRIDGWLFFGWASS